MTYGIINKVYTDSVAPHSKLIPTATSKFDLLLVSEENYSNYTVHTGLSCAMIQELNIIPVNFILNKDYIRMKTPAVISPADITPATGLSVVTGASTIWSLLGLLMLQNCPILINDAEVDLSLILASRSTDNLIVQYKTPNGFRSHILFNLFAVDKGELQFTGELETLAQIQKQYSECCKLNGAILTVYVNKSRMCPLDRISFRTVVSADLILFNQLQIETYKVCKLASTFSSTVMKQLFSVINTKDTAEVRKREITHEPAKVVYEVNTQRPTRPELTGLLYGCTSEFFLDTVKKSLAKKANLSTYLSEILPTTSRLDDLFKQEFISLTIGSDVGYDSQKYLDYNEGCNIELALLYLCMCELKCMLVEYDYYPVQLMDGISMDGVSLRLKKEAAND